MAQVKENGAVASDQFLTGELVHLIIDEVDGSANIAEFGYTAGVANAGEELVNLISTVANPVIIRSANARVMYMAVEVDGQDTAAWEAAINGSATFANATVTAGVYSVE